MNGAGRRRAPTTDVPLTSERTTAVTQAEVAELLAEIRRELEDALADGESADPYWALVGAALTGAISWTAAKRAIEAIEQPIVGQCRYCGGGLIEKPGCPPPTYVCIACGRLWPWSLQYNPPPEHFVEILGKRGPEKAS